MSRRTRRGAPGLASERSRIRLVATLAAMSGCMNDHLRGNRCSAYDGKIITAYSFLVVMSGPVIDPLSLIEDFVNTRDLEEGVERLGSPPALAAWLAEHGLAEPDETLGHADLARTRG